MSLCAAWPDFGPLSGQIWCWLWTVFPKGNTYPYRCFMTLCWRTKFILEWWQEGNVVSCLSSPRNKLKLKGIIHPLECTRRCGVCLRLCLESYQHGFWTPLPVLHVKSDTVGPRRTVTDNSDECRAPTFVEDYFREKILEQVFFQLP